MAYLVSIYQYLSLFESILFGTIHKTFETFILCNLNMLDYHNYKEF